MATDPDFDRLRAEADELLANPDLCPNARALVEKCMRHLDTADKLDPSADGCTDDGLPTVETG